MSGHSKWATTKRAKAVVDAKRGSIFTKHAKNIAIAAKNGGDPEMNPNLKTAIENARADNMPNLNIERAVKKGTGELKDGAEILELLYEGYGPHGIAVLVSCHTDNKQRTVANIRHLFSKHGGGMGESGCVSYLFRYAGILTFDDISKKEEIELAAIEADAVDIREENGVIEVETLPEKLHETNKILLAKGFKSKNQEVTYVPKTYLEITDKEQAQAILKFMEALDDDDDVNKLMTNFAIVDN